jgi:hypothetical protein
VPLVVPNLRRLRVEDRQVTHLLSSAMAIPCVHPRNSWKNANLATAPLEQLLLRVTSAALVFFGCLSAMLTSSSPFDERLDPSN